MLLTAAVLVGLAAFGSPGARRTLAGLRRRSTLLDLQLLVGRQLLGAVGAIPALLSAYGIATGLALSLDRIARPELEVSAAVSSVLLTLTLFVSWDASRYVVHRLMHEVPALWAFHQVHHSAEVLTPLTFHRVHPMESVLYQVRGALVTGVVTGVFVWLFRGQAVPAEILGVAAIGFVLNALFGNLRHSHVWLTFGPLERWLISPAQHQIHHATGMDDRNYGTWLAVWDRMAGSLELATAPPERYGIPAAERNHDEHLLSAWLGPLRELTSREARHPARAPATREAPDSAGTARRDASPAT